MIKIQGKEIDYLDVKHRPELWPVIVAEIERLKARIREIGEDEIRCTRRWLETHERLGAEIKRLQANVGTKNAKLLAALMALKNGDCWCDRYYDPMCGHQDRCDQAREAAETGGE